MKRIFLSMPILAMVTMIALFSCNKEEEAIIKKENKFLVIGKTYNFKSSKKEQNLTIGELHNAILKEAYKDFNYSSENLLNELKSNFAKIQIPENIKLLPNVYPENGTYEDVINENLSQQALSYINQANTHFEQLTSIDKFEQNITALEKKVLNSNLIILDKEACLIYLDVFKHSAYFWTPVSQGGSGEGEEILTRFQEAGVDVPPLSPATADVLGAAGGFIGGALGAGISGGAAGFAVAWAAGFGSAWASGTAAAFGPIMPPPYTTPK